MKYLAFASLLTFTACDAGSEDAFARRAAEIEGIYQVSAYTRNDAACEPGGESLLGTDTFALVATASFGGFEYVTINACASVADCRAQHARLQQGELVALDWSFGVSAVGSDGALVGEGGSSGFTTTEGICRLGDVTATRLTVIDGALRLEQRITLADDYTEDADGFCSTDAARAAAAGNPCTQFELVTGSLVEPL